MLGWKRRRANIILDLVFSSFYGLFRFLPSENFLFGVFFTRAWRTRLRWVGEGLFQMGCVVGVCLGRRICFIFLEVVG